MRRQPDSWDFIACYDEPRGNDHVSFWHIASFRCAAEFGRYPGIADFGKPSARQNYSFTA
jgi:hypothetical protein